MSKYSHLDDEIFYLKNKKPTPFNLDIVRQLIVKYPEHELKENALRQYVNALISKSTSPTKDSYKVKVKTKSDSKTSDYSGPNFIMSAWNKETGRVMNMDEYCEYYNLPRKDVKSYKFVSHTGTPHYNIVFKECIEDKFDKDFDSIIDDIVAKHIKPVKVKKMDICLYDDFADRLVYTDVHIGMNVNPSGYSMFGGKWDEEELMERCDIMVNAVIENRKGRELYIDDLGDVLDGWDGETTRGGHKLPQNMDNEKAFEVGLRFKMHILDSLVPYYDTIIVRNICNDNHAGSFSWVLNHAYKKVSIAKYGINVKMVNQRKFIDHYFIGDHAIVTSHGKDSKELKFGFKPHLDAKQIEKVDQYIKSTDIYQKAEYVEFSKGDSHQALLDMSGSDDFNYFNYPAFSPSSQWVQTNFKKGRSGFVIQHIDKHDDRIILDPHWFKWKK